MDLRPAFITHILPLWFLVLALPLPRISIALMYLDDLLRPYHLVGLLPPIFWVVLPRALVLYLIFVDQGVSLWFVLHLVVAIMVWGGSGRYHTRRVRQRFS